MSGNESYRRMPFDSDSALECAVLYSHHQLSIPSMVRTVCESVEKSSAKCTVSRIRRESGEIDRPNHCSTLFGRPRLFCTVRNKEGSGIVGKVVSALQQENRIDTRKAQGTDEKAWNGQTDEKIVRTLARLQMERAGASLRIFNFDMVFHGVVLHLHKSELLCWLRRSQRRSQGETGARNPTSVGKILPGFCVCYEITNLNFDIRKIGMQK